MNTVPNNRKKTLFVIGMERELERWLYDFTLLAPEQMVILKSYGPIISESYGSLMRSVLVAVFQDHVEEIFVVGSSKSEVNQRGNVISKMKQRGLRTEQLQTVEYLFQHCFTGFEGGVGQWMEGSKTVSQGVMYTVDLIRSHPFMPSGIQVQGLLVDTDNGTTKTV